jgi:hypothetical protein
MEEQKDTNDNNIKRTRVGAGEEEEEEDDLQKILQSAAQAAGINVSTLDQMFQSHSARPGKYDYIMNNLSSSNKTECMIALQELSEVLSIATGL